MRIVTATWGQSLLLCVREVPGGLHAVATAAGMELGPLIGSRNTFAKLYQAKSPADLSEADRLRAWVVLVAIGEDPQHWGLGDVEWPPGVDQERLRSSLPEQLARITHQYDAPVHLASVIDLAAYRAGLLERAA